MASSGLLEFRAVMARLRAECGWKSAQTHTSLARYLLEETHETLEAIDAGDAEALREELGDLLLQVYFHAAIAEEAGQFTIEDVAVDVVAKMRRRNPHVFGPGDGPRPTDPAEVNDLWESVKATEKPRPSVLDGIPPTLPALLLADKVLDRLARAGEPTPLGPTYLLLSSPYLGPSSWEPTAAWLRARGRSATVVELGEPTPERVVEAVVDTAGGAPVALVAHGDAGPDAPVLASRLTVLATVYVDAALADEASPAPAAYLALGDTRAEERARAASYGWPVRTLPGGHLLPLVDPAAVGGAVLALAEDLLGAPDLGTSLLRLVADARAIGTDPEQDLRILARSLADGRSSTKQNR